MGKMRYRLERASEREREREKEGRERCRLGANSSLQASHEINNIYINKL